MDKEEEYRNLIRKRKHYEFKCGGLVNPSSTNHHIDQGEPYAQWYSNLEAQILLVGKDFCDVDTWNRCKGQVGEVGGKNYLRTNRNLIKLFGELGIEILPPGIG